MVGLRSGARMSSATAPMLLWTPGVGADVPHPLWPYHLGPATFSEHLVAEIVEQHLPPDRWLGPGCRRPTITLAIPPRAYRFSEDKDLVAEALQQHPPPHRCSGPRWEPLHTPQPPPSTRTRLPTSCSSSTTSPQSSRAHLGPSSTYPDGGHGSQGYGIPTLSIPFLINLDDLHPLLVMIWWTPYFSILHRWTPQSVQRPVRTDRFVYLTLSKNSVKK